MAEIMTLAPLFRLGKGSPSPWEIAERSQLWVSLMIAFDDVERYLLANPPKR